MADTTDTVFTWGDAPATKASVLVHQLYGALDAGDAGHLAVSQILTSLSSQRVATFDTGHFVDYRSRRPAIAVEDWQLTELTVPEIAIDLVTDYSGKKLLVLHGPEPDYRWDDFSHAVIEIAQRYQVDTAVGLMGMPAGIPHTRSTYVHQTATDAMDVPPQPRQPAQVRMSASMGMYVQHWCGQAGMHSLGLVAGVPYYLADTEFFQGGAALIDQLAAITNLQLPVGDLEAAATQMRNIIDKQISSSEEVAGIVHMIEERYDSTLAQTAPESGIVPHTTTPAIIPSGDDIASKFQEFFHREAAANPYEAPSHSLFSAQVDSLSPRQRKERAQAASFIPQEKSSTDGQSSRNGEVITEATQQGYLQDKHGARHFVPRKQRRRKFRSRKQTRQAKNEPKKDKDDR
ncbi:MAG: PAC2 family protein [Actinomycetaceae bacterium]|nr:PAC2 family protein [Actinomycetaceae bacterium]